MSNGRNDNWFDYDHDLPTEAEINSMSVLIAANTDKNQVPSAGVKFDSGKPDLSLVPSVAMEEMARAFMLGEKKYGRYNYLKGMEVTRLLAATMRHLNAYRDGIDFDPEGAVYLTKHLGCVLATVAMILDCEKNGTLIDNRYKKE